MTSTQSPETHEARVWFYSLCDYNNGQLIDKCFNLHEYSNRQALENDIAKWLKEISTPEVLREEWILADFEGIPDGCAWEYGIHDSAFIYLNAVKTHGQTVALAAYHLDLLKSPTTVEDCYVGKFDTLKDFVQRTLEKEGRLNWSSEVSEVPRWLQGYIDFDAIGRDWMINNYQQHEGNYFTCL